MEGFSNAEDGAQAMDNVDKTIKSGVVVVFSKVRTILPSTAAAEPAFPSPPSHPLPKTVCQCHRRLFPLPLPTGSIRRQNDGHRAGGVDGAHINPWPRPPDPSVALTEKARPRFHCC